MKSVILEPGMDLPNLKPTILFADSETTSFNDYEKAVMPYCGHRACGWAVLADDDETAFYIPIRHRSPGARNFDVEPVMKWFQELVDHADRWVNHVVKFDAHVATVDGVTIGDTELVCTNALAKTVDSDRYNHNLKSLCRDWVGLEMAEEHEIKSYLADIPLPRNRKCQDYGRVPPDILGRYACMDVIGDRALYEWIVTECPEGMTNLWATEIKITSVLYDMEKAGLAIDVDLTQHELMRACEVQLALMQRFAELTGRELTDSPKLYSEVLLGMFGLPVLAWNVDKKTGKTTGPSFDKNALDLYMGHPQVIHSEKLREIVKIIKVFRKWSTYQSLFLESFLEKRGTQDGLLHSNYNQIVRTGRMSCSLPNTQQFDEKAAALIVPEEGRAFMCFDASQMEFRVIVHYIKDEAAIAAYADDPDTDFHQWVADVCGVKRKPAKTLNFAMAFGAGEKRVTKQLAHNPDVMEEVSAALLELGVAEEMRAEAYGTMCADRASEIYAIYHERLPGIRSKSVKAARLVRKRGWIRNAYGRRRHLPNKAAHKAFNSLVQGCAMDIIKEGMVAVSPRYNKWIRDLDIRILANKHDELLMDAPTAVAEDPAVIARIKKTLESPSVEFRVPFRWDYAGSRVNWKEAKP